jgi:pimeloyl-ACP methyl ester carboxylesterase
MPTAPINGIDVAYETYGNGPPLVLAHGYVGTKEMWGQQVGPFSERYRVIVYDVRGHGETGAPSVDDPGYTIETIVDDQRALMDHLGIDDAYIGGLSLGGMIAMRFALAHPKRVRALLLCDTSAGMGMEGQFAANRVLLEGLVRTQGVATIMGNLYVQHVTGGVRPSRSELAPQLTDFVNRLQRMDPDGFLGVARAAGDATSVLDRLPEISAPVMILTGEHDFFRAASEEMYQRLPQARFVTIRNSAHGTCLWQPEAFTDAVLSFLSDVEAGRPVAGREER